MPVHIMLVTAQYLSYLAVGWRDPLIDINHKQHRIRLSNRRLSLYANLLDKIC